MFTAIYGPGQDGYDASYSNSTAVNAALDSTRFIRLFPGETGY
jgi:hypothetical protein